jgi:hypothetical protein
VIDDDPGSGRPATIVSFPVADEERARRLRLEVERLARLPTVEWMFYVATESHAARYGVDCTTLKQMVEAVVREAERKQKAEQVEQRRSEDRAAKQRAAAQRRTDREEDKKARERAKSFAALAKLPKALQASQLKVLAKSLGEDSDVLAGEFADFATVETTASPGATEVWREAVNTKPLLDDILEQMRRYVVIHDDAAAAMYALTVLFAWVHQEIAVYSPLLGIQAPDFDAAKTTMTLVHALLTPRPHKIVRPTGPALYRLVDHTHPTLYIDNGDKLLARDRDLADIVNSSWTRGFRVPRTVDGNVYEFDPFCFKVINGIDLLPHLDPATRSRCIVTDLLPKLPDEKVVHFKHAASDERFVTLRRQAQRWADDNTAALASAEPSMPADFNNRLAENYALLFAIADLAGGDWPARARAAAVKLAHEYDVPSMGRRLLAICYDLFSRRGPLLTSKQVEAALPSYGDEWENFKGRGRAINKWEVAALLKPFKVYPGVIYPRGGHLTDRGYNVAWFETAFRHFLGKELPGGRTVVRKRRGKPRK